MAQLRLSLLLLSLLPSIAHAGPIDNTAQPCDNDPNTARPSCVIDGESIIVPSPMPNSDESVVTPPPEGVEKEPDTDIPPPMP